MIIKNASVFSEEGGFVQRDIIIENGVFAKQGGQEVIDAKGLYALPGFIDIHFHGCKGHDFCDATVEAIEAMASYEAKVGVTGICPAMMTLPEETLKKVCESAASYKDAPGRASLVGINMEGPFFNEKKKGAQNAAYLRKPDAQMFLRLQKASGGLIKLLDLAPELEGAMEVIEQLKDQVVISLAHTTADYDTALKAYQKGASHATHLYNAMPPFSHREPGVIGAAFDTPNCEVELITDGIHVHPSVVRATFQLFGQERIILISDSMMAVGLEEGKYSLGGQEVTVKGNKATLQDGTIAGSATNLADCIRVCVKDMGIDLWTAVKCATVNPAKSIGIYDRFGSITEGKSADLVLWDENLCTKMVICRGTVVE